MPRWENQYWRRLDHIQTNDGRTSVVVHLPNLQNVTGRGRCTEESLVDGK